MRFGGSCGSVCIAARFVMLISWSNNVRLLNCWHTAQLTILTSATQGGTQQPPRRAALYTEGLSRLNCCHTRRTAIESTAPTLPREHSPIKLLTTQFIDPERMKGWVVLGWLVTYRNKVPPPGVEPGHVTHPSTNRARRRVTSWYDQLRYHYATPPFVT